MSWPTGQKKDTQRSEPSYLAIVNPAAGNGRCRRFSHATLGRVRRLGIDLVVFETTRRGEASEIARKAYQEGFRNFLAVGGDGTSFEVLNGLFPEAGHPGGRFALGFLPLGTGNSFLRDFTTQGVEHTLQALREKRRRACDVIRLRHAEGELYFINLLSLGFPADVGETANREFKRLGRTWLYFCSVQALGGTETSAVCPPPRE